MDKKKQVWLTLCVGFFAFGMAIVLHRVAAPSPKNFLELNDRPLLGRADAPIEVVLIEDFQCRNCRVFSQKIIPQIQSHYIQKGLVRFTLVPVAFLAGSQAIANAALEVYSQNPALFFPYLKGILEHEGDLELQDFVKIAQKLGGISLSKLQTCLEQECHKQELERNLSFAKQLMGSQFRTPALFINGTSSPTFSFEVIRAQIDPLLEGK